MTVADLIVALGAFPPDAGYSYGRDAYPNHPQGVARHALLGGQIIFSAAGILGGLYFFCRAFSDVSRVGHSRAGFHALLGSMGILFGILTGAKLAF